MEDNKLDIIDEKEISSEKEDIIEINEDKPDSEKNYFEDLQRLQAEFENFVKRTEIEKKDLIKYSNEKLIFNLLKILDNFELALKHNEDEGVRLIYSELFSLLGSEGLLKIDTQGIFNPELHEALIQEEGEVEDKIVEELQAGYKLGERVIRPAKVKITKRKEN
jgi:molecular chaperone GrpE